MHLPRLKHLKLPLERRSYFYPILDQIFDCRHSIYPSFAAIIPERNRDGEPGVNADKFQTETLPKSDDGVRYQHP